MSESLANSEILKGLTEAGRQDLVDGIIGVDGWKYIDQAKLVYFNILQSKTKMSEEEILPLVEMGFIPLLTQMNLVPLNIVNTREILFKMRKEATPRDIKLIDRILLMTEDTSSDIDIVNGMSAVIKLAEGSEPYARIVTECGNFILESMTFTDEPIDLDHFDQIQSLNI